jgi:hypothetical protein
MVRKTTLLLACILILMPAIWATAAGWRRQQVAFTDPEQAGPDLAVQGEYVGKMKTDDAEKDYGAQVIALGNGRFRAVAFRGGLPGAGWDKSQKMRANGQTADGVTTFASGWGASVTIKDGVMTVTDADGREVGKLDKTERTSPTMGAKPPEGAVILFDGNSADKFRGGRVTEDGLLMPGAISNQTFESFSMHLEFQTPFMPTSQGQNRGNGGCHLQGRYEIQILDSFGLEGTNDECGGLYQLARPAVNMCLPPLAWQTFDVEYTAAAYEDRKKSANARVTVRHNGVLIHQDVELPRVRWTAPVAEGPEPGPISLQDHGNPVRFRNIWVVEKKIEENAEKKTEENAEKE